MKYALAAVLLLIACEPMHAAQRGSSGHHAVGGFVKPTPHVGRGQRVYPAYHAAKGGRATSLDSSGSPIRMNGVRVVNQGLAPQTIDALASASTEQRYRGELCRVLPYHAEQRACLRYQP